MPALLDPPQTDSTARSKSHSTSAVRSTVRWTVWPLRDSIVARWSAPAMLLASLLVVAARTGSLWCGLLAALALVVTLVRLWTRVTYIAGERGLEIQSLGRRQLLSWSRVIAFQAESNRILLHTGRPSLGERPRVIPIPLPDGDRAPLAEIRWRLIGAQEISAA